MSYNPISRIYIVAYKCNVHFARICIASIRYWYPDIPIYLIKDEAAGVFDTSHLEKHWNVQITQNTTPFRQGLYNAMAPFFQKFEGRGLVIDPDIVFIGKVLDKLEKVEEDYIVHPEYFDGPNHPEVSNTYYDYSKLKNFDPDYQFPGYCFNAGQIVFESGKIELDEVLKLFDVGTDSIKTKYPEVFRNWDQGIWNYILNKKEQAQQLTIGKIEFMVWPSKAFAKNYPIDLRKIKDNENTYPVMMHWAGITGLGFISLMTYSKILRFFRNYYYAKIPRSRFLRVRDHITFLKMVLFKILMVKKGSCHIDSLIRRFINKDSAS
jgi:hypothetical protein